MQKWDLQKLDLATGFETTVPQMPNHAAPRLVRGHRININDVPSLFSEGSEVEPARRGSQSWRSFAAIAQGAKRVQAAVAQFLAPPQGRHEEPVRQASMRR